MAPAIAAHTRPLALQRSHAYVNPVGVDVQVPLPTVRRVPTGAAAGSAGCTRAAGVPGATIGPTSPAYPLVVPVESVARTVSPIVAPTSRAVSRNADAVAPEIELQRAPSALQRYHWKR